MDKQQEITHAESRAVMMPFDIKGLHLDSFGMMFVIAWFGSMLWTPCMVPSAFTSASDDVFMHVCRLVFLVFFFLVYLAASMRPRLAFVIKTHPVVIIGATATTMIIPVTNLFQLPISLYAHAGELFVAAWAVEGMAASILMLVWCYGMQTKDGRTSGVTNVVVSCFFSGAMYILLTLLQRNAAVVLVMILPIAALVVWFYLRGAVLDNSSEFGTETSGLTTLMGNGSSVFVFTYGFAMGIAGGISTQFDNVLYISCTLGLSALFSGVVVIWFSKIGVTLDRRRLMFCLPIVSLCLFFLSFSMQVFELIAIFLIAALVQTFNSFNTAYIGEGVVDNVFGAEHNLFLSEKRIWDALGSVVGWALSTLVIFFWHTTVSERLFFLSSLVITVAIAVAFLKTYETGDFIELADIPDEEKREDGAFLNWEEACTTISQKYGLSPRESEIFVYLSKGRNRGFIAQEMFLSPNTVRSHTYNIYNKMGIHKQQQLISEVEEHIVRNV